MKRIARFCLLSGIALFLSLSHTGCQRPSNPQAETAATEAALDWLHLVDTQQYEQTWTTGSDLFQAVVKKEEWMRRMKAIRKPMGALISREKESSAYQTSMPGIPDGEYVIVRFKTSFQNKKSAMETVTMMLTEKGGWRTAGYHIK